MHAAGPDEDGPRVLLSLDGAFVGTLLTARCVLRAPVAADAPVIVALMTHPAVRRHLGGPASAEHAAARAAEIAGGGHPAAWAACLRQDPAGGCVGLVELAPHHDGGDVELSYAFLPAVWGRGLASEAVGAAVAHALGPLGLTRLVAETRAGNHPSRRLLERIGMRHERDLTRFGAPQALHAMGAPSGRLQPPS